VGIQLARSIRDQSDVDKRIKRNIKKKLGVFVEAKTETDAGHPMSPTSPISRTSTLRRAGDPKDQIRYLGALTGVEVHPLAKLPVLGGHAPPPHTPRGKEVKKKSIQDTPTSMRRTSTQGPDDGVAGVALADVVKNLRLELGTSKTNSTANTSFVPMLLGGGALVQTSNLESDGPSPRRDADVSAWNQLDLEEFAHHQGNEIEAFRRMHYELAKWKPVRPLDGPRGPGISGFQQVSDEIDGIATSGSHSPGPLSPQQRGSPQPPPLDQSAVLGGASTLTNPEDEDDEGIIMTDFIPIPVMHLWPIFKRGLSRATNVSYIWHACRQHHKLLCLGNDMQTFIFSEPERVSVLYCALWINTVTLAFLLDFFTRQRPGEDTQCSAAGIITLDRQCLFYWLAWRAMFASVLFTTVSSSLLQIYLRGKSFLNRASELSKDDAEDCFEKHFIADWPAIFNRKNHEVREWFARTYMWLWHLIRDVLWFFYRCIWYSLVCCRRGREPKLILKCWCPRRELRSLLEEPHLKDDLTTILFRPVAMGGKQHGMIDVNKEGEVKGLEEDGQADQHGVCEGWRILKIDGEPYSEALLEDKNDNGKKEYFVLFEVSSTMTFAFNPEDGLPGIECWPRSGVIYRVNHECEDMGIKVGWRLNKLKARSERSYHAYSENRFMALKHGSREYEIQFETRKRTPMKWRPTYMPCWVVFIVVISVYYVSFCLFMFSSSNYMEEVTYTDGRPTIFVPPPAEVEEVNAADSWEGFFTWEEREFLQEYLLVPRMQRYLILLVIAWCLHLFVMEPCLLVLHLFFNEPRIQDSTLFVSRVWEWLKSCCAPCLRCIRWNSDGSSLGQVPSPSEVQEESNARAIRDKETIKEKRTKKKGKSKDKEKKGASSDVAESKGDEVREGAGGPTTPTTPQRAPAVEASTPAVDASIKEEP
jgi:hypothetical protein